MADHSASITDYCTAIHEVFASGKLNSYAPLLADDTELHGQAGALIGKANVLQGLQSQLDSGWTAHRPLSFSSIGNLMTLTFRNDYQDGHSILAAAVVEVNEEGKIGRVWSHVAP